MVIMFSDGNRHGPLCISREGYHVNRYYKLYQTDLVENTFSQNFDGRLSKSRIIFERQLNVVLARRSFRIISQFNFSITIIHLSIR
jgi:hypothetical protein